MNVSRGLFYQTFTTTRGVDSDLRKTPTEAIIRGPSTTRCRWHLRRVRDFPPPLPSHAEDRRSRRRWTVLGAWDLRATEGQLPVMRFRLHSRCFAWSLLFAVAAVLLLPAAGAQAARPHDIDFNRDIRPLLSDNCYACHGPDEHHREAGLRLDVKDSSFGELDSGETAIVPGDVEASALYQRLITEDESERMPPTDHGKSLDAQQIALVRDWIEQGAPWQGHWAFVAPQRPERPALGQLKSWVREELDYFVAARLEEEGLRPATEADKVTLLRRVTLDLTGLPPTSAEIEAFLADDSDGAYEKVVDRLLDSPRYGEHLAHYWLDAARYADTHGLHIDNRRAIWPYRDWVIRAFNANLPFDQFTIEQLAGDLLPDPTRDQLVATGFNRCHVTTNEGGVIKEEFYVRNTVDRVETTATVWMGLTAGCAVCHDHKFDPLTKKEFYQLFAFFNSTAEDALDGNRAYYPPMLHLTTPEQETELAALAEKMQKLEADITAEESRLEAAAEQAAAAQQAAEPDENVETNATAQSEQKQAQPEQQAAAQEKNAEKENAEKQNAEPPTSPRLAALRTELAEARQRKDAIDKAVPVTMITKELAKPRTAYDLERGEYDKKGAEVRRDVPAFLPPLPSGETSVDRLALARWLVDGKHPLTARVTVNRFWQQLFGVGIVKTSEDFGAQGEWPSHPQLLDYLAVDFVDSGWNVKRTLKKLVMSATYRQSSAADREAYQADPENRLLARGPRFRMDAEVIRDSILAASGLLVERFGGEGVRPYQPDGIWFAVAYTSSDTAHYKRDQDDGLYRRSLYTFWKRTAPPPAMVALDAPSRETCRVRRPRTNTPGSALLLMNDEQYVEAARNLAQRMMLEAGASETERIDFAIRQALAREATTIDRRVLARVYRAQLAEFENDEAAARALLAVGDSPFDESLDVQQLAAWTIVANLILNLDEMVTKG
ncbi:MAG: DUF1553 domain-containing protein [Planctomycetota bacterium]|nr:MAG: DUF1553 domain-containing protein [Planctomycetota bacterium]REJ94029.1 MAG: DUF1553 domain-containing protein [Planctomycetota bacterium]